MPAPAGSRRREAQSEPRAASGEGPATSHLPPIGLGCSWESRPTTSSTCSGISISRARSSDGQRDGSLDVSQSLSEHRVSEPKVVCPCRFSLALGQVLPSCVQVTSAAEKTVDGETDGGVRSETSQKGFFVNMTTVLRLSGCMGHFAAPFQGRRSDPSDPHEFPNGLRGTTAA